MTSADLAREWTRSQPNVLAFINSLVFNFSDAEELLQETAAQIFEQAERYDASRPFLPWALGVARLTVLEHRRRLARDRHVFDEETVARLAVVCEELSERRELLSEALAICRKQLSARSRVVCGLRYEEGLTPPEIAARLGATCGAVRTWLHRIREQLRECVERRLQSEGARL